MTWTLIIVFLSIGSNYVTTSVKYDFDSKEACNSARDQLSSRLLDLNTIMTTCISDKSNEGDY